ncbi:putative bifunctional diguanylate cyclase/phosphodiesterase [Methylocystis parvus]|uniref:EAL domain-containing protein n=1 Tax=Methylocystis parvus TaxID=134 RepID=A0A6B8M872_9HYPH|nr:EAL domain-containing protein [Methylocystis parvus]QGM98776.1 EAL domain-containing protein [Methylocystis parvus]WBK00873.1 EAL domain-containing protein [Methylocystis parvus OBBP]
MQLFSLKRFFRKDPRLTTDVLADLVDSLYAPFVSLVLGAASSASLTFAVALYADLPQIAYCSALLAFVSCVRVGAVLAYRRRDRAKDRSRAALTKWEAIYAVGAYAFSGALGALDVVALRDTNDAVVHMLVLTVTTGCTAGAVVRNSGVRHIALGQLLFNVAPVCAAALARNEAAYYILAFTFFVFTVSAFDICFYQSANMLRVLYARKQTSKLAQQLEERNKRFDAALNNMPQGLCMLDGDGRLVVTNARVANAFGTSAANISAGQTIEAFASSLQASGALTQESADLFVREIFVNLRAGRTACTLIPRRDGGVVSATQAAQEDGGAVVIYEDVTERQEAEARVRYLATHDALTGLPNRALFTRLLREKVDACRGGQGRFSLLFVDLDRFKAINDTLGHAAGDALLREVSARLKTCLRACDAVARLGGDEFVVILHDMDTPRNAVRVAESLLACIAAPMPIAGQECGVSASIGVALYPCDGADDETLLRNADSAMYLAKAEGKGVVRLFSPKAKTQTLQGLTLENDLRRAIKRDEFLLVYQPKRCIATGAITGVEALLRWRHPELGLLPPDRFIPIAEESGLIVPMGKWVMERACAQHMAWRAQGLGPVSVAVNLSPRQLYDDHIVSDICEALAKAGMEPDWLELEITENMVMQDAGDALMVLRAIKETGVKLAIDDFGAGHTSFALIRQIPLDKIKIDRSFVNDILTDPNDRAIAEAIISLGQALKLRVVAEGVETEAQEAFLREHGCNEIQGYLFSRPLEADALHAFVSDHNLGRLLRMRDSGAIKKSA